MTDIQKESARLKAKVEKLFERVLSGDAIGVARELNGLDVPYSNFGIDEIGLLNAIAQKVFSDEWEWTVINIISSRPRLLVISYTEKHKEMIGDF